LANPASPATSNDPQVVLGFRLFLLLVVAIILAAVLRSAIATRLDSFTLDEGYHIVAGVSYLQRADFRINPEHPPLVKLWVGSFISVLGFHLSPFREKLKHLKSFRICTYEKWGGAHALDPQLSTNHSPRRSYNVPSQNHEEDTP
jgi:hypothetical protein